MDKRAAAAAFEAAYEERYMDGRWWYRIDPNKPYWPGGETRIDLTMTVVGRFLGLQTRQPNRYGNMIGTIIGIDPARVSQLRHEVNRPGSATKMILGLLEISEFSIEFMRMLLGMKEEFATNKHLIPEYQQRYSRKRAA